MSSLDTISSMHFFTKLLTGMILLLNIGLLVSIRLALKFAKYSAAGDPSDRGCKMWASAKRTLAILILLVVTVNAAAVYANHRMVNATRDIAAELPSGSDAELVLGMNSH
jgi:hypothetical protein